ncbi:mechanosensitive ion channel [Cognatishimia sp. SS12]|uniref:mechanosensitive ion channel family protein n=1 Tax=Cognatishimia sp. SS12 TaxID=2979465 RepID=UPI002330015F|nr:mechanosensitive ion channel domain-containing protein [Cognatishimia sp. SS12]MDC0739169.1 mechanosensitive ion channel [Cognatishimia sp. SS12]
MDLIVDFAQDNAHVVVNAVKALLVLIVGWILAGVISRLIRRKVLASKRIDDTIGGFAASISRWLILIVVAITVLSIFGIQATSLVAILGAATLAIGMALQGTLADLAAGFMLILFRPYRIGQYVDIAGTSGTVKDINLFVTELATPDNVQIIVPNGQAWGSVITNFSHHSTRRVDVTFGIDYGDDIEKAKSIILAVADADARVMSDPAPWVRVTNLGDSSVDVTMRVWSAAEDYWDVKFALTQAVKEKFDSEGISIPYPHVVEIKREA